ncbi:MAG: hypothetical protein ACR2NF_05215 [Pirellulales bacterium]
MKIKIENSYMFDLKAPDGTSLGIFEKSDTWHGMVEYKRKDGESLIVFEGLTNPLLQVMGLDGSDGSVIVCMKGIEEMLQAHAKPMNQAGDYQIDRH